ncbi:hypothetical protein QBC43DRAFT_257666 [Cladorrhinum sp. PSN259]|nr:hypothetical protein QBC43DRAFT_257666 [Cladorrhinum sp. PSN259]
MAPAIPSQELKLSYPLYAVEFEPEDTNRLIIGGGGGANRSGVGNKISVLDTSKEELQIVSEIELSRDEDSVNTIAVGPYRKNDLLIYAGINSSQEEISKGKNEHFRVFSAELPPKAKAEKAAPKITESSRTALFSTVDNDAYQRLLRISNQVGAIATGTTKDPQIAVFNLPDAGSKDTAPKLRGNLELVREATDMDLIRVSEDEYQIVYCDNYELHTLNIGKDNNIDGPKNIWSTPDDDATGQARTTFRAVRFLTPTFVLTVANIPQSGGVVLQGFRLPSASDKGKESREGKARLAVSAQLPRNIKRATGLAISNLTPSTPQGDAQFIIAVTDHQNSITLYTLEHQSMSGISLITKLHIVTTLKNVHPAPISGVAFSSPNPSSSTLKLASIGSMGNTLVVHTLPLKKIIHTNTNKKPRYVLALKSHGAKTATHLLIFTAIFALIASILIQGVLEVSGLARPRLGTRNFLPESWHVNYRWPTENGGNDVPPVTENLEVGGILAEYLLGQQQGSDNQQQVIVSANEEGEVKVVEGGESVKGKTWEELGKKQQEAWKKVLSGAGHWGEEVGEAVFKGVLFGEIGGIVANAVRG